jgi:predicted Zn-dependent protease
MKHILFAILTGIVLVSCFRVPITNRKQMRLFPESQLIAMADTAYRDFLSTAKVLPKSDPRSVRVERVGQKIAASIATFLKKQNASERIEGFSWEFNTVDDPTVNAWCMPGGKVVVYTGILPLAADDSSLAVVMGHEIAHAVARHGNERMSQAFAVQGLGQTLGGVMADPAKRNIFYQSYGLASTLGMLKYSRNHESEADKMGLVFMYLAGFNPAKAIDFWEKMSKTGGQSPPELLSTHPSDETRIADIKSFLPEIKKYAE